ncbi:hypothetical protein D3C73_576900 [compost metagenome]
MAFVHKYVVDMHTAEINIIIVSFRNLVFYFLYPSIEVLFPNFQTLYFPFATAAIQFLHGQ